jgi:hypothetical protein
MSNHSNNTAKQYCDMTDIEAQAAALFGQTTAPTPAPVPAKTGIKKLSLGGLTTKKESTKTAYPVFADTNGQAAIIAARIVERQDQFDALESALKTDKAELKMMVAPFYFRTNHGKHEAPSSVSVVSPKGEVLVTFQNRYPQLEDESTVAAILGDNTEEFFRQHIEVKIKGDALPQDKAQDIIDELQALFAKYNATDALEAKVGIKPTKDFHAARLVQFTPEVNLALDQACPVITMVKTKGRK